MALIILFCLAFFQLNQSFEFLGFQLSIAKFSLLFLLSYMFLLTDYRRLRSFWYERKEFFLGFLLCFILIQWGFLSKLQLQDVGLVTRWLFLYLLLLFSPGLSFKTTVSFVRIYSGLLSVGIFYGIFNSVQIIDWGLSFGLYPDRALPRISGLATGPNQLGAFSALGVWLALFNLRHSNPKNSGECYALLFLSGLSLVLSGSKSSALLAGAIWFLFVQETRSFKNLFSWAFFCFSVLVWHMPLLSKVFVGKASVVSSRLDLYQQYFMALKSDQSSVGNIIFSHDHLHNFVLDAHRQGDFVSMFAVVAIVVLIFVFGLNNKRKTLGVLFIAVGANFLNGSFGSSGIFQLYFAVIIIFSSLAMTSKIDYKQSVNRNLEKL